MNRTQARRHKSAPHSPLDLTARLIVLAAACAPVFFALPVRAQVSLATVVALAERNSSEVKLANTDLSKAVKTLAESQDVYVPNLTLGSGIGPPSIGFTFSQPSIASATMQSLAFSFPQRQYIAAARRGIEAARLRVKDSVEQAALEVSSAYLELDTVSRELETSAQQAQHAERLVAIEKQRQEAGIDPMSDLLQARLSAAQLHLSRMHLEARARTLVSQIVALTGLQASSIRTDHASIPEIPAVRTDLPDFAANVQTYGLQAAEVEADSRKIGAHGDLLGTTLWPQVSFGAQYNRDATSLNNYNVYFSQTRKFKADNFSAGFAIQIPIYDIAKRDKARQSVVEALRSTLEAEQARRQNDIQIATLTGSLRELDALAEVASLKQQIAAEQVKAVEAQLESGNGAGPEPGAPPQLSPKAEQLARIDEGQKALDALEAAFNLDRARLNLLRALGHISDWLQEIEPGPDSAVQAKQTAALSN